MERTRTLEESARNIALERFRIIQPCFEEDRSLSVIVRKAMIPVSPNQSIADQFRRFGLAAPARKLREDRGKRRALSPQLLEGLALEVLPLPVAAIYRRIFQIVWERAA
jgi:putative transposase